MLAVALALPLAHAEDTADPGCDWDEDGYDALVCDPDGDCNDGDPSVHPDAEEIADDGLDQDCDGLDLVHVSVLGSGAQLAGGAGTCGLAAPGSAFSLLFPLGLLLARRRTCASP